MRILYNATIYTLDSSRPIVSAIAMERERVLAVGETDSLISEFERADKQDMDGQTILPGLIDAHLHLQQYALSLQKIDCETETLDECLRRVEERARSAKHGEWVLGHGWNQNTWFPSPPGRGAGLPPPTTQDRPPQPVYLTAVVAWLGQPGLSWPNCNA
jgi:predicted amidohydrolase YtcJ